MSNTKVSIIGVGNVGSTLAYNLATNKICSKIVLKDIRENIVEAMTLDISQSASAANSNTIVQAAKSGKDLVDSNIVVITAGVPRKPGMSRDDLLLINAKIIKSVIEDIKEYCPNTIIIVVSNPLDAMVYAALKISGFKRNKVIGMAGILDSARMSHFIHTKLGYGAGKIKSYVMGGHGDDMVPLVNYSTVENSPITEVLSKEEIADIVDKTKNGGLQIVKLLEIGSAYYAPAHSTSLMVKSILNNDGEIYPCSVMLEGEYGHQDVVAGVPIKLDSNGLKEVVEFELTAEQKELFNKSINSVKELTNVLDNKFFN
ncbi:malate dehydrogenase [Arcobacter sp.]|uniref:malate dehydrogenase n=1 Tax=Arcobacter sp. TaxID=1872629 RepID=UPI003C78C936